MQATVPGMTEELSRRLPPGEQIWEWDQLAAAWGFDPAQLELPWPKKEVLLEYTRQAFEAVEHAISFIDEEQFQEAEQLQYYDDE